MNLKDIQIDILSETIGILHKEIAELRSALIILNQQLEELKEAENGEHQDSTADEPDNDC